MAEKKGEQRPPKRRNEAINSAFADFFEDYERRRWSIYRMNFVRGVAFGLGTFIGGSLVIAGLLWFLSLFQDVPFLTDFVETIQNSIENARPR
ncbi:MAG TPA: DUF5665 domain-containing protein [Candidatus Saccharimonadales bacterium]|nr:DUF5665 domain-containing protein [Candidatus Saccharimonadales bacterium]